MQSAFITLIECMCMCAVWIFIMSQRITLNAQSIDSSSSFEQKWMQFCGSGVCTFLQNLWCMQTYNVVLCVLRKNRMNGLDIKDQGQCETNNVFKFLFHLFVVEYMWMCLTDEFQQIHFFISCLILLVIKKYNEKIIKNL